MNGFNSESKLSSCCVVVILLCVMRLGLPS